MKRLFTTNNKQLQKPRQSYNAYITVVGDVAFFTT